jgi:hypothetical protein
MVVGPDKRIKLSLCYTFLVRGKKTTGIGQHAANRHYGAWVRDAGATRLVPKTWNTDSPAVIR